MKGKRKTAKGIRRAEECLEEIHRQAAAVSGGIRGWSLDDKGEVILWNIILKELQ